jgi:hypothetical protein
MNIASPPTVGDQPLEQLTIILQNRLAATTLYDTDPPVPAALRFGS